MQSGRLLEWSAVTARAQSDYGKCTNRFAVFLNPGNQIIPALSYGVQSPANLIRLGPITRIQTGYQFTGQLGQFDKLAVLCFEGSFCRLELSDLLRDLILLF